MGFISAGLLQGLGSGLTMQAQQMREDALLKLKRQYQLDDNATAQQQEIAKEGRQETRDIAKDERDSTLKTGLLTLAQEYKRAEGETEQQWKERLLRIQGGIESGHIAQKGQIDTQIEGVKFQHDKALAAVRADLEIKTDAASQKLKQEIDKNEVSVAGRTPDGRIILKRGSGELITMVTKMAGTGSSEDGTSIGDVIAAREGKTSAPAKAAPAAAAAPAKAKPAASVQEIQNSLDAMLASRSIPVGHSVGQTMTGPNGEKAKWDGERWVYLPPKTVPNRGF